MTLLAYVLNLLGISLIALGGFLGWIGWRLGRLRKSLPAPPPRR